MSGAMTVYLAFGNRTYRNGPFHGTMASVMGWFKYKECSIRYGIQWQLQIIWMWVSIGKIIKLNLVGGWPTPLKDMTSSVGMMTFPYIMENHKCHVPKHQSVNISWRNLNSQCQASTTKMAPVLWYSSTAGTSGTSDQMAKRKSNMDL